MSEGIEALLKAGIPVNIMSRDPYNEAYSGMNVMINHRFEIVFREGRSTPQKKGHFVTLWKKDIQDLQNIPYCLSDLKDGHIHRERWGLGFIIQPLYLPHPKHRKHKQS
ncbi:MepB family protein [Erysipelothrix piscisicarius]|uniref:MepB family protein n=1 Tax=Erysipelothrix piscisicarius TaxID=2485784 RepID=UPI002F938499